MRTSYDSTNDSSRNGRFRSMTVSESEELLKQLRALPKMIGETGKSIVESSEYDGISLWWFVHNDFRAAVDQIVSSTDNRGAERQVSRVARNSRICSLLAFAYLAYQFLAFTLGRLLSTKTTQQDEKRVRILMISQNRQWKVIPDQQRGKARTTDAFFDSIISALQESGNYEIVTTYPLAGPPDPWYYPFPGLKTVFRRRRDIATAHRPFDGYWSIAVWQKSREARRHFSREWAALRYREALRVQVDGDDSILNQIVERLAYYFLVVYGRVVGLLAAAERLLEREKPRLVLLMNEYGRFERSIVFACRLRGIPTLAIQHGVIHPFHHGYIYASDEVSKSGSVESPYCPIPDRTAAYGPYYKELLTEVSSYPKDSVVVTGQPRYDSLHYADQMYDRNKILLELGLDPRRKLVLWATQTHGLPADENERNIEAVYQAIRQSEDLQLVIKLHPGEDQRAPQYKRSHLYKPTIIGGSGNTISLLYACDLMITRYSTTALEAVALNKPVIILNLSEDPDLVDYVQEGVAVGVYRARDLRPAIKKLLVEDGELARNREQYIRRYLYRVDGKATERVVNLIDEMIGWTDKP